MQSKLWLGRPNVYAAIYCYHHYHTLVSASEVGWERSGLLRHRRLLEIGNETWPGEYYRGYPDAGRDGQHARDGHGLRQTACDATPQPRRAVEQAAAVHLGASWTRWSKARRCACAPLRRRPPRNAKAMFGYWVIMWIRYTVMRIRIDQMLAFNWKFLTPVAFVLLMLTALMNTLLRGTSTGIYILGMFLTNVLLGWIIVEILRGYSRSERQKTENVAPVTAIAHH